MYIYQVNEDGVTCASRAWDRKELIPDGWTEVPAELGSKFPLFFDGDIVTDKKPKALEDKEKEEFETEEKIRAKMREFAIGELIKEGELPPSYKAKMADKLSEVS